jgi:parallel beta-helix repeat protein
MDIQSVEPDDTGLSVWVVVGVGVVVVALISVSASLLILEFTRVEIGAPERSDSAGSPTSGTLRVWSDTTLAADHNGDIIIEADHLTLDCAGFTITGPGRTKDFHGVSLWRKTGVTVKNCFITNHNAGFLINQSNGNVFTNNTVSGVRTGFTLFASDHNTIERNLVIDASDWFAYGLLEGSDSNTLTNNNAKSTGIGFMTVGSNNIFNSNEATLTSGVGIAVDGGGSKNNTFARNTITNNSGVGIEDTTTGAGGDAGTDNSYNNNVCDENKRGDSSPGGLC